METSGTRAVIRATPALLKDLRTLKVMVFHPEDRDGEQLTQQLQRIGCQVQGFWPPLPTLPEGIDVVILAVRPDIISLDFPWCRGSQSPTVIAVVTYENPTIVETVLRIGAKGILPSPVRSFGLLSSLVLARQLNDEIQTRTRRIQKLENKLLGQRKILEAKAILMETRHISENEAFNLIREQAMEKRVTNEEIATVIINANDILSFKKSGRDKEVSGLPLARGGS
ncbi:ANTAR domain-containing protein [Noviherbaspirillum cavernae]|uniref:ANTAR domain-containing protein n=1 Tax=Noviherbaspirillum cavernae TaxID=2320862 RepID=A0A418WUX3_9BURK|nr:ANTAR domain-containing protein [Noviherbaspirillum cavernae]RJF96490.1 ANTAR domain-containing protein [Noviherbaspirillum cavernae]